ncbi:MAG: hypothetical protein AAF330_07095 [Pseudomonadota bacterium]
MAKLTPIRLREGIWEGEISGPSEMPHVMVTHQEVPLIGVEVDPNGTNAWILRAPVPASTLGDGLQTYVVSVDGDVLGSFGIAAGAPLAEDLRSEISLLRAELDMLKRAFRRHCVETMGAR